jgi:hypothetical protein
MVEELVSNELGRLWMAALMAKLGYYTSICQERLRKATRNLNHKIHYVTQDSK